MGVSKAIRRCTKSVTKLSKAYRRDIFRVSYGALLRKVSRNKELKPHADEKTINRPEFIR